MGLLPENIVTWAGNGIEYVYPRSLLREIFEGNEPISITEDVVSAGDISVRKIQLAREVVRRRDTETPLPTELEEALISKLAVAIEY